MLCCLKTSGLLTCDQNTVGAGTEGGERAAETELQRPYCWECSIAVLRCVECYVKAVAVEGCRSAVPKGLSRELRKRG